MVISVSISFHSATGYNIFFFFDNESSYFYIFLKRQKRFFFFFENKKERRYYITHDTGKNQQFQTHLFGFLKLNSEALSI